MKLWKNQLNLLIDHFYTKTKFVVNGINEIVLLNRNEIRLTLNHSA